MLSVFYYLSLLALTSYDSSCGSTSAGRMCKRGRSPCLGMSRSTRVARATAFGVGVTSSAARAIIGLRSCTRRFRARLKVDMSKILDNLRSKDMIFCPVGTSQGG